MEPKSDKENLHPQKNIIVLNTGHWSELKKLDKDYESGNYIEIDDNNYAHIDLSLLPERYFKDKTFAISAFKIFINELENKKYSFTTFNELQSVDPKYKERADKLQEEYLSGNKSLLFYIKKLLGSEISTIQEQEFFKNAISRHFREVEL